MCVCVPTLFQILLHYRLLPVTDTLVYDASELLKPLSSYRSLHWAKNMCNQGSDFFSCAVIVTLLNQ